MQEGYSSPHAYERQISSPSIEAHKSRCRVKDNSKHALTVSQHSSSVDVPAHVTSRGVWTIGSAQPTLKLLWQVSGGGVGEYRGGVERASGGGGRRGTARDGSVKHGYEPETCGHTAMASCLARPTSAAPHKAWREILPFTSTLNPDNNRNLVGSWHTHAQWVRRQPRSSFKSELPQ